MTERTDTLLAVLVRQRRLTQDETVAILFERARQLGIREGKFGLTTRQLQRWVAGHVKQPHPAQCRVLEAEFRRPVEELLAAPQPTNGRARRRGLRRLRPGNASGTDSGTGAGPGTTPNQSWRG